MKDCIFCKIVTGQSSSDMLYQDDRVTAFRDIHPVAPTHVLIVPNQHIPRVHDLTTDDNDLVGHMFTVARLIAEQEQVDEDGYRIILNNGPHGGQIVYHLHLHLIAGRCMRHPMG